MSFQDNVKAAFEEAVKYQRFSAEDNGRPGPSGEYEPDVISELSHGLVPVYSSDRMDALVETGAYHSEDVMELAGEKASIVDLAGIALYLEAEERLHDLLSDWREAQDPGATTS